MPSICVRILSAAVLLLPSAVHCLLLSQSFQQSWDYHSLFRRRETVSEATTAPEYVGETTTATEAMGKTATAPGRKNVLFIMADDMNPDMGAYGNKQVHTPNMDGLAAEGVTFEYAYTNFAVCAPSRNSLMSGRLPDTTRVYTFQNHFREEDAGENWRSMPQYFKEVGGYYTAVSGKIMHALLPPNNDYPKSWSAKPYTPDCRHDSGCPDSTAEDLPIYPEKKVDCVEGKLRHFPYCAAAVDVNEKRLEKQLVDQRTRDACIRFLREGSEATRSGKANGFFVACGFHKPHLSYVFPAEFLKYYPRAGMHLLEIKGYQFVPRKSPMLAWAATGHGWRANISFNATQDQDWVKEIHRANYAAISFVDDCIGGVLKTLDELQHSKDTVVVVTSDHGVQLNEQGVWGKMTNWEGSLRVPLIIRAPWLEHSHGKRTGVLAELVDVYPTLADLAGLPAPDSEGDYVNGTSLAQVFREPESDPDIKPFAFSQMAKPSLDAPGMRDLNCPRSEVEAMGYSVRTDKYRYTAWFKFDATEPEFKAGKILARELYKYVDHRNEVENIAGDPEYAKVVKRLHRLVVSKIRVSLTKF